MQLVSIYCIFLAKFHVQGMQFEFDRQYLQNEIDLYCFLSSSLNLHQDFWSIYSSDTMLVLCQLYQIFNCVTCWLDDTMCLRSFGFRPLEAIL